MKPAPQHPKQVGDFHIAMLFIGLTAGIMIAGLIDIPLIEQILVAVLLDGIVFVLFFYPSFVSYQREAQR